MNKKLLILIIALALLLAIVLVGCDAPVDKGELPVKWDAYIQDIADDYYNTFKSANGTYSMSFNFAIAHVANNVDTLYEGRFKFTQSVSMPSYSAFEIDVYATKNDAEKAQVFYFAGNNSNAYLFAQSLQGGNDLRYHFENTPIFSLYRIDLADPTIISAHAYNTLKEISKGCDVNSDKSIYTMAFDLDKFVSNRTSDIDKLFSIIPTPIIEKLNEIFNTNVSRWGEVLKDTKGKADINISKTDKIDSLKIYDLNSFADDQSKIKEIVVSNIQVKSVFTEIDRNLATEIEKNKQDYTTTKLGNLSVEGTLDLVDSATKRSAVRYDYKFNSSIDILELANNNFDFSKLDDNNYLHIRISHTCTSNCSAYCNTIVGNKLDAGKGAMIDIAFSPKDFGTKYVYISLGVKQLIGENTLNKVGGLSTGLINLVLPEYILLTLDTAAYAIDNDVNNGLFLLQVLMGLNSNLSIYSDHVDVDIYKMLSLANAQTNPIIKSLLDIGGYNIDTARINYSAPQFGVVTDYNIYQETVHIIGYDYADTKNYTSLLYSPNPSIDWQFSDYVEVKNNDETIKVHNLYWGEGQPIYTASVPISPQEIVDLKGCYVNYTYTDIYKDSSSKNVGKAKIIDVLDIDKSLTDVYQIARLKVQLPSKWIGISVNADDVLYVYLTTHIKLTSMDVNGLLIERTDKDSNGALNTKYVLQSKKSSLPMLNGKVTIKYSNSSKKTITLIGSCNAVKSNMGISTTYTITNTGSVNIIFRYAGKVAQFAVDILQPNSIEILEAESDIKTFRKNQEYSYSSFNLAYANLLYSNNGQNKTERYAFDFRDYFINGKTLAESGMYWDTYIGSNSSLCIKFKVDGRYKVDIVCFGVTKTVEIVVTSNVIGKSTYQIVSKNQGSIAYAGSRLYRRLEVKNKTHGVLGEENLALSVEVYSGTINSSGNIVYYDKLSQSEDSYLVKELKYNGSIYDATIPISLPSTLYKPIAIAYDIYIQTPGYYRITTKLSSGIYVYEEIQII